MSYALVRSLVHRVVKNTPSVSRISSQNLQKFCIDIALVTLGFRYRLRVIRNHSHHSNNVNVRTGYLLDLFSFSETTAREFGASLREVCAALVKDEFITKQFLCSKEDSVFKDVLLLFHTHLEQLFFVNVSLLHDRHIEARSIAPWTSFIYLTPEPQNVQYLLSLVDIIVSDIFHFTGLDSSHGNTHHLPNHPQRLHGTVANFPYVYIIILLSPDDRIRWISP